MQLQKETESQSQNAITEGDWEPKVNYASTKITQIMQPFYRITLFQWYKTTNIDT